MEWLGPEGPEMNPEERRRLVKPHEMLTGLFWAPLMCAMAEMGQEVEVSSFSWWPQGMEWRGNCLLRWR